MSEVDMVKIRKSLEEAGIDMAWAVPFGNLSKQLQDAQAEIERLKGKNQSLLDALPDPAILHYAADWWRLTRKKGETISPLEKTLLRFAKQASEARIAAEKEAKNA